MISEKKKFLFIHVPKTGGNSIQNILSDFADDKIVIANKMQDGKERFELKNDSINIHKHSILQEYKNQLDSKYYKGLYKFSVIRNPYERLISHYFSPNRQVPTWDRNDFLKLLDEEIKPLQHYIRTRPKGLEKITDSFKALDAELDYLIKFENIDFDIKQICEQLEIPFMGLPHRNKSEKGDYKKYYDSELLEIIQKEFSKEIEFGDYTF